MPEDFRVEPGALVPLPTDWVAVTTGVVVVEVVATIIGVIVVEVVGVVEYVVLLDAVVELVVVIIVEVLELVEVVVDAVLVVVVLEDDVVDAPDAMYVKEVVPKAELPSPPQVALTMNVPATHAALPPG